MTYLPPRKVSCPNRQEEKKRRNQGCSWLKRMRAWLAFEVPKLSDFLWTVPQVSSGLPSSITVRKPKQMHKVLQPLARALAFFNVFHLALKLSLDAFRQRWRLVDTRSKIRAENRHIENRMHMLSTNR
jgi:hypothetical protein